MWPAGLIEIVELCCGATPINSILPRKKLRRDHLLSHMEFSIVRLSCGDECKEIQRITEVIVVFDFLPPTPATQTGNSRVMFVPYLDLAAGPEPV